MTLGGSVIAFLLCGHSNDLVSTHRVHARQCMAYGTVLSRCVHALQHDQEGMSSVGEELVLQLEQFLVQLGQLFLCFLLLPSLRWFCGYSVQMDHGCAGLSVSGPCLPLYSTPDPLFQRHAALGALVPSFARYLRVHGAGVGACCCPRPGGSGVSRHGGDRSIGDRGVVQVSHA